MLDLGVLVLILTPVFRVLVFGWGCLLAGDRHFAWIAGVVLALLGMSFLLGVG